MQMLQIMDYLRSLGQPMFLSAAKISQDCCGRKTGEKKIFKSMVVPDSAFLEGDVQFTW